MNQEELFLNYKNIPKPLTKEETHILIKKMNEHDETAKEKLIKHNIFLVIYEVNKKFKTVEYEKKELVSIGIVGLIKAISTYDFRKKVELSSYAVRCIDNEILMFLRKLKKDSNVDRLDREIYIHSEKTELTLKDIISDSNNMVDDFLVKERNKIILNIINELPEREKKITKLYYGFYNDKTYTQKEISEIFSLTQPTISRLIVKIEKKLLQKFKQNGLVDLNFEKQKILSKLR